MLAVDPRDQAEIRTYMKANSKGLNALIKRETPPTALQQPAAKAMTSWLRSFGKKWYFLWLF
jgi:hypothetical protein